MAVTLTVSNLRKFVQGSERVAAGTLTSGGADTYLTNGFTVTAASLGLHTIRSLQLTAFTNATPVAFQPRVTVADPKNGSTSATVRLYGTSAGPGPAVPDPEVTNSTALVTYASDFEAIGS